MFRKAKKTGKKSRTRNPRPSLPAAPVDQPSADDAPGSASDDQEAAVSRLTPRQQAILPAVAISPSIAQAARDTGVSERTLRRWLDNPAFRDELSRLQQESYDIARKQLQALVPHFISVLAREAIENPDPSIRIRASRYGLSFAVKFREIDDVADAIRDLRGALNRNV